MHRKIISVDWDDTIALWPKTSEEKIITDSNKVRFEYNEKLLKELASFQERGCEIHVTTFRGQHLYWSSSGQSFGMDIHNYIPAISERFGIDIKDVHYTNGGCKTKVLNKIKALRHYDDSSQVCCTVATSTETWPVFIDHGERNSFLEQLVFEGKIERWKLG